MTPALVLLVEQDGLITRCATSRLPWLFLAPRVRIPSLCLVQAAERLSTKITATVPRAAWLCKTHTEAFTVDRQS